MAIRGLKRLLLSISGLMLILSIVSSPQTITGTWQGTLPIAENQRVVLKIAKAEDGSLYGTYIMIDREAAGVPLTSASFMAGELNAVFSMVTSAFRARSARMVSLWMGVGLRGSSRTR